MKAVADTIGVARSNLVEDIASAVLFFVVPYASSLTDHVLQLDGGSI